MILSVQQIKFEMLGYIKEFDSDFGAWFVGIAGDPRRTLQSEHGVDLERDIWFYRQAQSFAACRTIQRYFCATFNADGKPMPSGTEDMDCVYLYKKSGRTRP